MYRLNQVDEWRGRHRQCRVYHVVWNATTDVDGRDVGDQVSSKLNFVNLGITAIVPFKSNQPGLDRAESKYATI